MPGSTVLPRWVTPVVVSAAACVLAPVLALGAVLGLALVLPFLPIGVPLVAWARGTARRKRGAPRASASSPSTSGPRARLRLVRPTR